MIFFHSCSQAKNYAHVALCLLLISVSLVRAADEQHGAGIEDIQIDGAKVTVPHSTGNLRGNTSLNDVQQYEFVIDVTAAGKKALDDLKQNLLVFKSFSGEDANTVWQSIKPNELVLGTYTIKWQEKYTASFKACEEGEVIKKIEGIQSNPFICGQEVNYNHYSAWEGPNPIPDTDPEKCQIAVAYNYPGKLMRCCLYAMTNSINEEGEEVEEYKVFFVTENKFYASQVLEGSPIVKLAVQLHADIEESTFMGKINNDKLIEINYEGAFSGAVCIDAGSHYWEGVVTVKGGRCKQKEDDSIPSLTEEVSTNH